MSRPTAVRTTSFKAPPPASLSAIADTAPAIVTRSNIVCSNSVILVPPSPPYTRVRGIKSYSRCSACRAADQSRCLRFRGASSCRPSTAARARQPPPCSTQSLLPLERTAQGQIAATHSIPKMPIEPRSRAAPDSMVSVASEIHTADHRNRTGHGRVSRSPSVMRSTLPETPPAIARYAVNGVKISCVPRGQDFMPSAMPRSMPLPAAASTAVMAR